jgi:hypothetical protein
MKPWNQVVESKIVWAPIGYVQKKDGSTAPRFSRIGVRVDMADGTHWHYSFKHESWTHHHKPVQALDRLGRPAKEAGRPVFLPPKKNRWDADELQKEFSKRSPELLIALQTGVEQALQSE